MSPYRTWREIVAERESRMTPEELARSRKRGAQISRRLNRRVRWNNRLRWWKVLRLIEKIKGDQP